MENFFGELSNLYRKVEEIGEENVGQWGAFASPPVAVAISIIYLSFVLAVGPKIMKDRSSLNLTYVILFYNAFQVVFNCYLWTQVSWYISMNLNSIQCLDVERPGSIYFKYISNVNWLFAINKFLDLLDTIFFVLRKKQSHISFLHVYHHLLTFTGAWFLARYAPGGQIAVFAFINTFVHVIMYSYYFISACGSLKPSMKRYSLLFKKPTTQLQIIQFVVAGIHAIYGLFDENCKYPRYLYYFGLVQDVIMIVLFSNFYRNTYMKDKIKEHKDIIL